MIFQPCRAKKFLNPRHPCEVNKHVADRIKTVLPKNEELKIETEIYETHNRRKFIMVKLIIPKRSMETYNIEKTFEVTFTEEGLALLKNKFKNVRGLPAFLHNTLKGRPTPNRELILENCHLHAWTEDLSTIVIPNTRIDWSILRKNPFEQKDSLEGLALVGWIIDPRLLPNYGLKKRENHENIDTFRNFILNNDKTRTVKQNYRYFCRADSQEEIAKIESTNGVPYLATILDLTSDHIPLLKKLAETSKKHLIENYGVNLESDLVELYFHFPYTDGTTTLHMHIVVNQGRHPMERLRSFSLDEIITCLEKGQKITNLILNRKPYYTDNEMVHNIKGIIIKEVINPHILNTNVIEYDSAPKTETEVNLAWFKNTAF